MSRVPDTVPCLAVETNTDGAFNPTVQGQLVITTDDGNTWTNDSSNFASYTAAAQQISCASGGACGVAGPAVTTNGAALFARTVNSGASWSNSPGPTNISRPPGIVEGIGIACSSTAACVMVGDSGSGATADVTTNGGTTWTASSTQ